MEIEKEDFKTFAVFAKQRSTEFTIKLNGSIENEEQFDDAIAVLEEATEYDCVIVKISSNGGSVSAIIPFLDALKRCPAHRVAHVISIAASAATLPIFICDEVIVNDHSTIMLHTASGGAFGTVQQNVDNSIHWKESTERLARDIYQNFLTEDEYKLMFNGKEFWYSAKEFTEKLQKTIKLEEIDDNLE